ncbi:MAG: DUF3578 domain-containing protein [Acholeplasma sp.]|nr:DUF3578 domain-containing protein [Acholeplasma sp.]
MFGSKIDKFNTLFKEEIINNRKVDKNMEYYKIMTEDIPSILREKIPNEIYKIYGSVGQGNLSQVPWFGVFNRQVTDSATYGVYIVYLFSIERDKIYLTLNQGFTNFKDLFKRNKYTYIRKTADYLSSEMKLQGFDKGIINLGNDLSNLAKGYEYGTIVFKEYDINMMPDDNILFNDLNDLLIEYDELVSSFGMKGYDSIIKIINGVDESITVDRAIKEIKEELDGSYVMPVDVVLKPKKVSKGNLKVQKYLRIKNSVLRQKLDYVRIAKDNARIGLQGEKLALQIEKERLEGLGIANIDKKLFWRANESDSYGYDIESVDIINGKETKLFIEVKTTSDRIDSPFYISKKEKEFSEEEGEKYRIFRIYDVDSTVPKYYFANGKIEDNFILDPITFLATYKYELE